MMKGTENKLFKGDECNYSTSNKSHLRSHMMTHNGNKPMKCKEYDYSASLMSNIRYLSVCMMKHTGNKE